MKKRQRRNTCALAQEQNRVARAMAGRPPKEDNDGEDRSDNEQIRLDPYYAFDRCFRQKSNKGARKGKGSRG